LFELPGVVVLGVRRGFGAPDLEVFDGQWLPHGGDQDLVRLERVEGCRRRLREATDAAAGALPVTQIAGVLVDRLARVEATLDPVEGGRDHAPERDVRVS